MAIIREIDKIDLPSETCHVVDRDRNIGYFFGGKVDNALCGKLYSLDFKTDKVTELGCSKPFVYRITMLDNAPVPRFNHAMAMWGSKILVYGGKDSEENTLRDLWYFDPDLSLWKCVCL